MDTTSSPWSPVGARRRSSSLSVAAVSGEGGSERVIAGSLAGPFVQGVLQYETGQPDSGVHPHGLEDDAGAQSVYVVEAQDRLGVPRGEVVEPGLVGEQVRDRGYTST
nr:hypothetical protein [Janibacter indicus]